MTDLAALTDDELSERYDSPYRHVRQAGCPRYVVLDVQPTESAGGA